MVTDPLATDHGEQISRPDMAAALLYGAHAEVKFDTDEDRALQQKVLAEARAVWPQIEQALAELREGV